MIPTVKNNNFSELILYSGRQPVQFKATRGYSIKASALYSVSSDMSVPTWVFQTLYKIQSHLKANTIAVFTETRHSQGNRH